MKHVMIVMLVFGALVLAGCGGQKPAEQPSAPAPSAGRQTASVKMSEFKFEVSPAAVQAGKVTFELENMGTVEHSFIIETAGIKSEQIRPGQKVTVQADLRPGTYTAICDVAGHKEAGMQTEIVVK